AIGLIVGAILLVAMPSLRSLNPLSTPQFDSTDETPASYNLAVRRAAPAVVNVYNRGLNTNSHNQLEIRTLGSGVIMDQRGYIITNKHVINDADQIIVALQDGRVFEALLVGSDSLTDLAVLKINATGGLPTIPINARRVPHIGDVVLAIGNPYNLGQTITQGIISATGRIGLNPTGRQNFLQTDASINHGNSGGALVGREIAPLHAQSGGIDQLQGIVVNEVSPDGPAANAGIQVNDLIISVDNKPAISALETMDQVAEIRPGSVIPVVVMRDDKQLTLQVTIQEYPATN
ncbi:MAG: trypsin-like peptidase domain-containing protein, partial [Escherichia coli]|nr:trypsin-like peptidase domain-containing protein [Escherichia coli]